MNNQMDKSQAQKSDWQFTFLLAVLVILLFFAMPFITRMEIEAFELLFIVLMLAGIYAVSGQRRTFVVAIILAAPAITLTWIAVLGEQSPIWVQAVAKVLVIIFFGYLILVILREVMRRRRVSIHIISGAFASLP
jgi:4-hydroxybenzoate polyprenyltransferase